MVEHLEILDISLSGIRFNCMRKRRIEMNSIQTIKINKGDISITLHGLIVRATLKMLKDFEGADVTYYDVAMKFIDLTNQQKDAISKLIRLLGNE